MAYGANRRIRRAATELPIFDLSDTLALVRAHSVLLSGHKAKGDCVASRPLCSWKRRPGLLGASRSLPAAGAGSGAR